MTVAVYVLCALTSLVCAGLLLRAWLAGRARLLLWCMLCFVGLAVNNVMLVVDEVAVPDVDLSLARSLPALGGILALVGGLIWETRAR